MENTIELTETKRCLSPACNKLITVGRIERLFCDDSCRYAYHNIRKLEENRITGTISNALKRNRRILDKFLKHKQVTSVPEKKLTAEGFNFQYHTHTYLAKKTAKEYVFCFDLGYRVLDDGCYQIVRSF